MTKMQSLAVPCVLLFLCVQIGYSLKCWTCTSDAQGECADYFNLTKIRQQQYYSANPDVHLMDCPQFSPNNRYDFNQRAVCMKKTHMTHGRTFYTRSCQHIKSEESVGYCPTDTSGSSITVVEFCQYCDYDGCNGSTSVKAKMFLVGMLPVILYMFFAK